MKNSKERMRQIYVLQTEVHLHLHLFTYDTLLTL
jgi:hypothetical protein